MRYLVYTEEFRDGKRVPDVREIVCASEEERPARRELERLYGEAVRRYREQHRSVVELRGTPDLRRVVAEEGWEYHVGLLDEQAPQDEPH